MHNIGPKRPPTKMTSKLYALKIYAQVQLYAPRHQSHTTNQIKSKQI